MRNIIVVGAFDLVSHDLLFYDLIFQNDYKAIFIEPVEIYFNQLVNNAKKLTGECYFENTAISDKNEEIEIEYVDPQYLNLYADYINGCSSAIENGEVINRFMKDVAPEHKIKIKINTLTIDDICKKYDIKEIHYLQIDTEGYDERIVNSIDLNKYNIKKLKFEKHYLSDGFVESIANKYTNYKIEDLDSDYLLEKL